MVSARKFLPFMAALLLGTSFAHAEDALIVADQKGQQKALLEAAGQDRNLPYTLRWTEFEAAAPLLQALAANAVDTGIAGDGPFLFAWGAHLPIKAAFLVPPRGGGESTAVVTANSSPIHTAADLSGKKNRNGQGINRSLAATAPDCYGRHSRPSPSYRLSCTCSGQGSP
ncbi:ABC-type nitrate/sulfonate/bicarbonate transport systems [Gluconobacter frateurii NBRC 103465]|nr:ABC-type nitrate/sulfonate/bicarbonate transport systems [Gluconobacter frateurii NBRC 103465]